MKGWARGSTVNGNAGLLTVEGWVLFLTAVGVIFSAVAAWAAIRSVKLTQQGLEKQNEQLWLERELAARVPELEVSRVSLVQGLSVWEVRDTLEEKRKQEQEEAERWAEDQRGFSYRTPVLGPFDPYTIAQRDYRGPTPDAVMKIQLKNKGRIAAENISGNVALNLNHLEILDFPGLDASGVSDPNEYGIHTAEVGVIPELLPGKTEELRVALRVYMEQQATTTLKYDFITPAGYGTSGERVIPDLG